MIERAAGTRKRAQFRGPRSYAGSLQLVLRRLGRDGFLVFSDPALPSVVGIVAGGSVRGSWWGHPAGRVIYEVGEELDRRGDLLSLPLLRRKSTLVTRPWWPMVMAIGSSRSVWQLAGLGPAARQLLDRVGRSGVVDLSTTEPLPLPPGRSMSALARELETRLLVVGRSEHTELGRHVKKLESWPSWGRSHSVRRSRLDARSARDRVERHLGSLYSVGTPALGLAWSRGIVARPFTTER